MAAQVGTIIRKIGGVDRTFSLLDMEDIVTLTAQTPSNSGELVDVNALNKWSQHPIGSIRVLVQASQKLNPKLTYEEVKSWGSILRRTQVANELLIMALVSGEEPESDPKVQGGQASPAIGGQTPATSPTTSPV